MTNVPEDLRDALKKGGLDEFFSGCTGPHQREYLKWIADARRPETRRNRVEKTIKLLADKRAEETARSRKR